MTRSAALMLALLAAAPAHAGHRLALLIGADHGDAGEAELRYAATDAERLGAVLRDVGDFAADDVMVLTAPTPAKVERALAELHARSAAAGDDALVFVFYSGHADGESLHLGGASLPFAVLRDAVAATPAAARILVVDACRSGTLTRVKGGQAGPAFDVHLDAPLGARGFAILTSSAAGEDAQESDAIGSSLFTHFFTSALIGAGDKNGDGQVTLEESFGYASERTILATSSTQVGPQHPTFRYDLGGRAGLVLTQPGAHHAHIGWVELPEPGWFVLRRSPGPVVAEIQASRRGQRLALESGRYLVSWRFSDYYLEGAIDVAEGAHAAVASEKLHRYAYPRGMRKGLEAALFPVADRAPKPLYKKWWLWTVVGVVAVGVSAGVGIGLAESRRESTLNAISF